MALILVTGGAGYIGSFTVRRLLAAGHGVTVLDNFSAGHRESVPEGVTVLDVDLQDEAATQKAVAGQPFDAMIHFAGSIEAGQSMTDPKRFYRNNVLASMNLIDAWIDNGANRPVVFSSTAAVYGDPDRVPIAEGDNKTPVNVYGETKLAFEGVLNAYDRAYGLRSIALRYFNACGADPDGSIGEHHLHETHLIPLALFAASEGKSMKLFGTDYDTPDGTCVRDYVHVYDLADAHVLAVGALLDGAASNRYNVGLGRGFSVTEVLDSVERVTGNKLEREIHERRAGDPSSLVADSSRLRTDLGWAPQFTELDAIVSSAHAWHSKNPTGY